MQLDMNKIRDWARENGHKVGVRGPIGIPVISAYLEAQEGAGNVSTE